MLVGYMRVSTDSDRQVLCQIAFNSNPHFASNHDPRGRLPEAYPRDG